MRPPASRRPYSPLYRKEGALIKYNQGLTVQHRKYRGKLHRRINVAIIGDNSRLSHMQPCAGLPQLGTGEGRHELPHSDHRALEPVAGGVSAPV
jgi:hypothetical protein